MTAVVVLAAGESRRMGVPKQLLDFRGVPLLRHAALTALEADCGPVIVVLGARSFDLRPAIANMPVETVVNVDWELGMGGSIQTGLRALEGRDEVTGAIVALADQPYVTAEFLRRLASAGSRIVAARYAGTAGVPAYFSRATFPLLMALSPEQGCKGVILGNAELLDCPEAARDIDTPEDYRAAVQS